ncbi:root phototropism protein 3 [Physcomitrium patens]|uniref:NPH3 domain-containing protein n=1 Tax=Physcomitrium patens TaxID=3218 RepID=A0A7I4B3Q2_PHYPA|nr:root phototropism protein 3-like [Physcomitrium patens]|eukprot:XP_024398034.1 root phototropism protein 3-like [Physcomitrella patens]
MAIMTRHAVEAFPSVDALCVGARCSHVRSNRSFLDVDSPRYRPQSHGSSPVKKKASARTSSFEKKGQTWVAAKMLQSDLLVEVADMSFHLHKFPLLSRSGRLNHLVFESRDTEKDQIKLDNMPGGPAAFELAVKFCYGIPIVITSVNVVALRCAAEYLEMTEDLEVDNLVSKTEDFLNSEVLTSWTDSITVLRACEKLSPWAEKLQIVKKCSESIAWKACTDPRGIRWSYSSAGESPNLSPRLNGSAKSSTSSRGIPQDWWFADVAELNLKSFKVVMNAIKAKGMRHDVMGSAVVYYAYRWLPGLTALDNPVSPLLRESSPTTDKKKNKVSFTYKRESGHGESQGSSLTNDVNGDVASQVLEREFLEGIVEVLPPQKDSVPVSCLLRLLRLSILLDVSLGCRKELEARSGAQLDQATLSDLLIPSCAYRSDTVYDVGAVHRCLDHFLVQDHIQTISQKEVPTSSGRDKNGDVCDCSHLRPVVGPHAAKMKVAKLIDSYLAEIARDGNLTFSKFQALAEALPDFSRTTDDGLYRAIDTFLKEHPSLSEHERKKLCRMMDCQRLSLEACMHAAQNERLPLRIVVQVLFSEQLKLRNAISSTTPARPERIPESPLHQGSASGSAPPVVRPIIPIRDATNSQMNIRALQHDVMFMKAKFAELQRDYTQVTQQVEKLTKQKGSWVKRLFHSKDHAETTPSPWHPRWSRAWRNSIS